MPPVKTPASLARSLSNVNSRQQGMRRFGYAFGLLLAAAVTPAVAFADGPTQPAAPAKTKKAPKADDKSATTDKDAKADPPEVKSARGVVVITRAGVPVGLGGVLMGDGRISSALSPLGSGNDLEARFADGT